MTVIGHGYDDNVGAPANRNRIINGAFVIDQRNAGASQTITAGTALAYTVDRWYAYCTGANITTQRVAGTAPFQYNYRMTGLASNTAVGIGTRLEAADTFYLAGTTATLSAYIASSSLTSVTWTMYYANTTDAFGTLASPTRTQIATGSFTVSSTLSRKSVQVSIPAAATTGLEVVFSGGALLGSQTLTFAGVQLEAGSVVTPYEFESFETTLRKCQRYYYQINSSSSNTIAVFAHGAAATVGQGNFFLPLKQSMRTTPTLSGSANIQVVDYGSGIAGTPTLSVDATTSSSEWVGFNTTGQTYTQYRPLYLRANSSSAAYIGITAEL